MLVLRLVAGVKSSGCCRQSPIGLLLPLKPAQTCGGTVPTQFLHRSKARNGKSRAIKPTALNRPRFTQG